MAEMDVTDVISAEDSVGRKAVKVLYPLFLGQFFGLALTAATFVIVTRLLGPTNYGAYVFAFGFSALVNGVSAFGIGAYFNSTLASLAYKKDGEGILKTLSSGYVIAGLVGILLSIAGIALSGSIAHMFPKVGVAPLTLMLTSSQIFFYMISMIAVNGLVGLSRSGLASITNIIVDIVQLSLSVVLTILYGVNGAVIAMLAGYAVGAALGTGLLVAAVAKYIKPRIVIPAREALGRTFSFVWPIAAKNFLSTGMTNFSILFLGLFVAAAALGNYGAANRGLTLVAMLYGTFGQGLLNTFSTARSMKRADEINLTYNSIMRFSLLFMLPVVVFIGIMSAPSLFTLISTVYSTAPTYLMLMCIGTTIGLFSSNISSLLISENHTRSILYITLVSAVAQFALIVTLVPVAKVVGAIVAIYFIGNATALVLFIREARRKIGLRMEKRPYATLYFGNFVLGLVLLAWLLLSAPLEHSMAVPDVAYIIQLAVALVITVVVYPVLLIALRSVSLKDIAELKNATARFGIFSKVMGLFLGYSEYLHNKLHAE